MVRYIRVSAFFDAAGNKLVELIDGACEHTDTKPTDGIATGSIMTEVDTGKVFFFSEESGDWVEQFSFQS